MKKNFDLLLRAITQQFSAIIALLAMVATAYQAYVTRDQEKQQLRAYVFVVPSLSGFAVREYPRFSLELKNGGQTPAYNPVLRAGVAWAPYPLPRPLPSPSSLRAVPSNDGFLYEDHILMVPFDAAAKPLSQAAYDSVIKSQQIYLYIFGDVEYSDTFHQSHRTKFCFVFGADQVINHHFGYCNDPDYGNQVD